MNKKLNQNQKECDHPWQYVEVGYDNIDMCIKSICHKCGKINILKRNI